MNSKDNKGEEKGKNYTKLKNFLEGWIHLILFFSFYFDGDDCSRSPYESAGDRLKKTIGMPGFIFIADMSLS